MPVVFSGLMCHAPVVLPQVGGGQSDRCRGTTRAMREVADRVVRAAPDRVVLVSPHAPRRPEVWSALTGRHRGDLSAFGAPGVVVDLPNAPEVAEALQLAPAPQEPLDHGAMVPLRFLAEAGWDGPVAILALPWSEQGASVVGEGLRGLEGRTAVIASGDMSHALQPGAPGGYHPQAAAFDAAFVRALRSGAWEQALAAPHREVAREDVVTSSAVAMAASGEPVNPEVLWYEAPWGVGYGQAVFFDPDPALYAVARSAIVDVVQGRVASVPSGGPAASGVFVTLTLDGQLRGCIGQPTPTRDTLYAEVVQAARSSATRDPRCRMISESELVALDIEVSVLSTLEDVTDMGQLDPATWGIVVSRGEDRGLLLPSVQGVETPAQQVGIARRKAGIGASDPVRVQRFRTATQHRP